MGAGRNRRTEVEALKAHLATENITHDCTPPTAGNPYEPGRRKNRRSQRSPKRGEKTTLTRKISSHLTTSSGGLARSARTRANHSRESGSSITDTVSLDSARGSSQGACKRQASIPVRSKLIDSRLVARRPAIPLAYDFNKIVEVDLSSLDWRGREIPILNVLDHGTNFQWCGSLPDRTAQETWAAFTRGWLAYFGSDASVCRRCKVAHLGSCIAVAPLRQKRSVKEKETPCWCRDGLQPNSSKSPWHEVARPTHTLDPQKTNSPRFAQPFTSVTGSVER